VDDSQDYNVIRIQRACTVSEQQFQSFAISNASRDRTIRTSRLNEDIDYSFLAAIATSMSLMGYIIQFIGLRAMHWTSAISSLGGTLLMTAIRSIVRRGLAKDPPNKPLHQGLELSWLAYEIMGLDRWEIVCGSFDKDTSVELDRDNAVLLTEGLNVADDREWEPEPALQILRTVRLRAHLQTLLPGQDSVTVVSTQLVTAIRQVMTVVLSEDALFDEMPKQSLGGSTDGRRPDTTEGVHIRDLFKRAETNNVERDSANDSNEERVNVVVEEHKSVESEESVGVQRMREQMLIEEVENIDWRRRYSRVPIDSNSHGIEIISDPNRSIETELSKIQPLPRIRKQLPKPGDAHITANHSEREHVYGRPPAPPPRGGRSIGEDSQHSLGIKEGNSLHGRYAVRKAEQDVHILEPIEEEPLKSRFKFLAGRLAFEWENNVAYRRGASNSETKQASYQFTTECAFNEHDGEPQWEVDVNTMMAVISLWLETIVSKQEKEAEKTGYIRMLGSAKDIWVTTSAHRHSTEKDNAMKNQQIGDWSRNVEDGEPDISGDNQPEASVASEKFSRQSQDEENQGNRPLLTTHAIEAKSAEKNANVQITVENGMEIKRLRTNNYALWIDRGVNSLEVEFPAGQTDSEGDSSGPHDYPVFGYTVSSYMKFVNPLT
jgi:hypothetical protein